MGAGEFIEKMDNVSLRCFERGAEIAEFLKPTFPMSETEGDRLTGYMEGHGYLLGYGDGKLYRGDLCYDADKIYWEAYTLYNAVEDVRDWNYGLLEEAGIEPDTEGAAGQAGAERYTAGLWEDKMILDELFGRIFDKEENDRNIKRGIYHA